MAGLEDYLKTGKSIWDLGRRAYRAVRRPATEAEKARNEAIRILKSGEGVLEEGQTATGAIRKARIAARPAIKLERAKAKELNPGWFNSLSGKQKAAVIVGAPLGGAAAWRGKNMLFSGSDTPAGMQDPAMLPAQAQYAAGANLPTSVSVVPGAAGTTASTGNYIDDAIRAVQESYANQKFYAPGQEMYDKMTGATKQLSQSTVDEMNKLAQQYAAGAAGMKEAGAAGASAINDVYRSGAATLADIASTPMGEYDTLTPVSGAAATAPEEAMAAGQTLADYLRSNQLISAQEQGGMAALAQMLGPAYQNQYNLMDLQFRSAAEANKARLLADAQNASAQNLQNDLLDLRLQGIQAAEQDQKLRSYAESVIQWGKPEATTAWKEWVEKIAKDPTLAKQWEAAGVTTPQQYVNYKRNQEIQNIIDQAGVQ